MFTRGKYWNNIIKSMILKAMLKAEYKLKNYKLRKITPKNMKIIYYLLKIFTDYAAVSLFINDTINSQI